MKIVISSGHGKYIRGASGYIDEVDEARRVVEQVAAHFRTMGVGGKTFHDNTSTSQNQNLSTIVNYHNAQSRDLDVSVHFNAYQTTSKPMGTECLYVTQSSVAGRVAAAVSEAGTFINRGAKYRSDLYFLNNTHEPSVLVETCFVDSSADANLYNESFSEICIALAESLSGESYTEQPPERPERPERPEPPPPSEPVVGTVHGLS